MSGLSCAGGLYSVIWIPALDPNTINQSCCDGSGTWSQLVCLSLWLVCLQSSMSVKGLRLVLLLSRLSLHEMSLTLGLVWIVIMSFLEVYHLVRDFLKDYGPSRLFFYVSTTFTTDSRVVGSDVESAPVEHINQICTKSIRPGKLA